MIINDKIKSKIFLVIYSSVTVLLIINAVRYKMLVDIIYTAIFVCIYLRYIHTSLS